MHSQRKHTLALLANYIVYSTKFLISQKRFFLSVSVSVGGCDGERGKGGREVSTATLLPTPTTSHSFAGPRLLLDYLHIVGRHQTVG